MDLNRVTPASVGGEGYRVAQISTIEASAHAAGERKDEGMHDPRTMHRICGSTMPSVAPGSFFFFLFFLVLNFDRERVAEYSRHGV